MVMRRFLVWMIAVAALVALAAPASASRPMEVTGSETFFLTPTCDPGPPLNPGPAFEPACRTADGNVFITVLNPAVKTGTFEGTQLFDGTITVFKNGDFVFHGFVTFTGTVEGCGEGTVVFVGEGSGNLVDGLTRSRQHATGQGTLGVRANLDLITTGPNTSAITGTYSC